MYITYGSHIFKNSAKSLNMSQNKIKINDMPNINRTLVHKNIKITIIMGALHLTRSTMAIK